MDSPIGRSTAPAVTMPSDQGLRIAVVSNALGVPLPTLRSWELRYGMPAISHPKGRHRRYLPAEVHALRLMRDEVARGQQAGLAAATVRRLLGIGGPAGAFIHRLLDDSEQLDTTRIRAGLDEAAAALGLGGCVDEVLLPVMRQVGIWWEMGHCDVPQERITTEAVRAWLDKRIAFAPAPTRPRPILLGCGPRDLHTVGLESMAMLLRYQGWPVRMLGARTPTEVVLAAATATDAAAVVMVSQMATGRRPALESIQAIAQIRLPVFYAGGAFSSQRSRVGVPGSYLGTRIQDACALVISALTADELVATS